MLKAIIEFERKGIRITRPKLKELIKKLNLLGGIYLLDYFSQEEIKEKCMKYLDEIVNHKKVFTKDNKMDLLMKKLSNKNNVMTGKQIDVVEYLVNNIYEIPKYRHCDKLASKIGVSSSTLNIVLLKLRLGSFSRFSSDVKEIIEQAK